MGDFDVGDFDMYPAARLALFGPEATVTDVLSDPRGLISLLRATERVSVGAAAPARR